MWSLYLASGGRLRYLLLYDTLEVFSFIEMTTLELFVIQYRWLDSLSFYIGIQDVIREVAIYTSDFIAVGGGSSWNIFYVYN